MSYGVQLPQYPLFKPCSRYGWPQVIKPFLFFLIGDGATGTLHLVHYRERTQSSLYIFNPCVCVFVCPEACLWPGERSSSFLWENLCHFIYLLLPRWATEVETWGKTRPMRDPSTSRWGRGCSFNRLCVAVNRVLSFGSCRDSDLIVPSLSFYLLIKYPTLLSHQSWAPALLKQDWKFSSDGCVATKVFFVVLFYKCITWH